MKKRLMAGLATGAFVGAMMAGGAGSALAGEVTGNGEQTPIKDPGVAASHCAFSGQNDQPTGNEVPIEDGRVQSYGQLVRQGAKGFVDETFGGPGQSCNPNNGAEH
jgi:hypothetical protein